MPFGINRHSNRSKQALNESVPGTATPSSGGSQSELTASPIYNTDETRIQPQAFNQQPRADAQPYISAQSPAQEFDNQQRSGELPTRSQSTRYVSAYQPSQQPGGSADDLTLDTRKYQQREEQPHPPAAPEHKKSKSIFDRMRSGSSREQKQQAPRAAAADYNNTAGLARRLSKRQQENPPIIRTGQQRNSAEQQRLDWSAGQDPRSILPSPQEGTDDDIDPYLVREEGTPHIALNEEGYRQTIRPVQAETDSPSYATDEDPRHFEAQQQHSRDQSQHYHSESGSQIYYHPQNPSQPQVNIDPTNLTSDPYRQNPETVSQLSYDSPTDQQELRPGSVQSNGQSPTSYVPQRQEYPSRTTSIQSARPLSQYNAMAPPGSGTQQSRRSGDPKQTAGNQGQPQGQPDSREGPPPTYSRGQFPNNQPPTPGLPTMPSVAGAQGPNYRGGPPQREQYGPTGGGEQGRSTPPPAPGERDVNDVYKELLTKYKKVKGLYFDKTSQVEQLQNTLANQRLSQSRTSLDDSEYMTRFQRLDGATTNLAFNIRKDWRSIPPWLAPWVNQDALKIGKQEMTAVGRACITKFLVEEVFNRTFHPGLETELSLSLKTIEQNIRRFSPALNNQEESDALTAKVVQWRLATLEGLRDVLNSPTAEENKEAFKRVATTNLTASLMSFLVEPVPAGIEDSAHMIVELAVSIAANLPLESRDISITYPMPGDILQPVIMKVEAGIPILDNPSAESPSDADGASTGSGDKDEKDEKSADGKGRKEKGKSGMLSAMMGGSSGSATGKKGPSVQGEEGKKGAAEDGPQKVRLAGFVGVEVRGRQMLVKAPVWTVG